MEDDRKPLIPAWDSYDKKEMDGVFIVGLAGYRRVGKTTIAKEIARTLEGIGIHVGLFSFATRLKEVFSTLVGGDDWKKTDIVYGGSEHDARWFLSRFATEFMQVSFGRRIWVDILFEDILAWCRAHPTGKRVVIIDDFRFPHESSLVETNGAAVLVRRKIIEEEMCAIRAARQGLPEHASEAPEHLSVVGTVWNNCFRIAARDILDIVSGDPRFPRLA